jgi:hypothetical protein
MLDLMANIHVHNVLGVCLLLLIWLILCEAARIAIKFVCREPLIGWAVGPLGVTAVFLHKPSWLCACLDVLGPTLVSGSVLLVGLSASFSPVDLPVDSPVLPTIVVGGALSTCIVNVVRVWRDICYPLWGEARVLRTIQRLRSSYAAIYFTAYGNSYLQDHFRSNSTELLQVL